MRVKASWVVALLLAGCQTTQPLDATSDRRSDINNQAPTNISLKDTRKVAPEYVVPPEITPEEQQDVWLRISSQFSLDVPDNPTIEHYRRWFINNPNHLVIVSERATPFLFRIAEKIEQRGLPMELALLPVVESSFDAFAYSHGSAAGLWQFVSGTGKLYGLKQNYWYDGRRDVDAATDAALDFLTDLGKQFNGNWYQAIAAYNSGGGRVARAIKQNQKAGKPTDFFSLNLPKETSSYVPKLLALADVVAHQDKYGIVIPAIPNKPVLTKVNPEEQLDLAIAARYAGISVKELQSYNPAYNQWATAPNGPYQLLIPANKADRFARNLAENRGNGMKLVRYKVQKGDSLSMIATKHSTTTKVIQKANDLSGNTIRIGQYLMIPTAVKDENLYALSAENRLQKIQSRSHGKFKMTHTVRAGESLWSIAKNNNVTHTELAKWNGMAPGDTLKKGQKLVIWQKNNKGGIIRTVKYRVRSGDTISEIASRFRVTSRDIIKWNDLANVKYLRPGQELKLYVDVTKVNV